MARLFSIEVLFNEKVYMALVTFSEQGQDLCCQVRYVDQDLRHILPGDKLVVSLQQGVIEPKTLPGELAESLVQCTTRALSNYIESKALQ